MKFPIKYEKIINNCEFFPNIVTTEMSKNRKTEDTFPHAVPHLRILSFPFKTKDGQE